ncbi:MAG: DUF2344 domain-containing protein [Faecalibacterium sp.]|nr:DUF2344 domain-containing protein [Faecalibacterium sp.]
MTTVRIWFEKRGEASYISLLDLQRVMQRVIKRSGVPVWYTLGFNPHIYMTFTCPLPLGQESLCESVDVKTEAEHQDFEQWKTALNAAMPTGITVFKVEPVQMKATLIGFADYEVRCPASFQPALDSYNALPSAQVQKKTKRGFKSIELKEYMPVLDYKTEEDGLVFAVRLPASGDLNLNPSLLAGFLQQQYEVPACEVAILRTALWTAENQPFI